MEYSIWILVAFFRLELLFRFESIRAAEFVFPFFSPFSRVFDFLFPLFPPPDNLFYHSSNSHARRGAQSPGAKIGPFVPQPQGPPLLTQWACTAQFCTKTAASISLRVTFRNFLDVFKGITPIKVV